MVLTNPFLKTNRIFYLQHRSNRNNFSENVMIRLTLISQIELCFLLDAKPELSGLSLPCVERNNVGVGMFCVEYERPGVGGIFIDCIRKQLTNTS